MPFDATRVQERRLPDGTSFNLYVPPGDAKRLLVSVLPVLEPDIPRVLAIELFADFAEEHGYLVLAPGFAYESDFRLLVGETVRWDVRLLAMVEDVGRAHAIDVTRVDLVGYSAGGQFAHRFLYVHPERLEQIAAGGIGRVTVPKTVDSWPDGVADMAAVTGKAFDVEAVGRPRILLYVGDQDLGADGLERGEAADRHGLTRLERARSLHRAWLEVGIPHEYVEVPGMKHDDGGFEHVQRFLSQGASAVKP